MIDSRAAVLSGQDGVAEAAAYGRPEAERPSADPPQRQVMAASIGRSKG
jgi:hypothetical protein